MVLTLLSPGACLTWASEATLSVAQPPRGGLPGHPTGRQCTWALLPPVCLTQTSSRPAPQDLHTSAQHTSAQHRRGLEASLVPTPPSRRTHCFPRSFFVSLETVPSWEQEGAERGLCLLKAPLESM